MGYKFEGYYLHVNGPFSKISVADKPKSKYELFYTSSETSFKKGLMYLL